MNMYYIGRANRILASSLYIIALIKLGTSLQINWVNNYLTRQYSSISRNLSGLQLNLCSSDTKINTTVAPWVTPISFHRVKKLMFEKQFLKVDLHHQWCLQLRLSSFSQPLYPFISILPRSFIKFSSISSQGVLLSYLPYPSVRICPTHVSIPY